MRKYQTEFMENWLAMETNVNIGGGAVAGGGVGVMVSNKLLSPTLGAEYMYM